MAQSSGARFNNAAQVRRYAGATKAQVQTHNLINAQLVRRYAVSDNGASSDARFNKRGAGSALCGHDKSASSDTQFNKRAQPFVSHFEIKLRRGSGETESRKKNSLISILAYDFTRGGAKSFASVKLNGKKRFQKNPLLKARFYPRPCLNNAPTETEKSDVFLFTEYVL